MCKPSPGLPCASHARAALTKARRDFTAAVKTAAAAANALEEEERSWRALSINGGTQPRSLVTARIESARSRSAVATARSDVATAQAAYDMTPQGLAALRHAAEAAPSGQPSAAAAARYAVAQRRSEAAQAVWLASPAHTEERLPAALGTRRLPALVDELSRRRCVEASVELPPTDPRARQVWSDLDPHGRVWSALVGQVGASEAGLTFMRVPPTTLDAPAPAATCSPLLSAHFLHLPSCLLDDTDLSVKSLRAAASGKPIEVDHHAAVRAAATVGDCLVDTDGTVTNDGQELDTWRVLPLGGPVALTMTATTLRVDHGWLCVRDRDHTIRVLPDLSRFGAHEPTVIADSRASSSQLRALRHR